MAPNVVHISVLLSGCSHIGDAQRARKIWRLMLLHRVSPDISCFINMIKTLGQRGDMDEARTFYGDFKHAFRDAPEATAMAIHGAMLHALLKNDALDEALSLKRWMERHVCGEGGALSVASYVPLMSYFLRDAHCDPERALRLLTECVRRLALRRLDEALLNIACVALLKALQMCAAKRHKRRARLFGRIEAMAALDCSCNWQSANVALTAHVEFYGAESAQAVRCLERMVARGLVGLWSQTQQQNALDLHGLNYAQIELVLHYVLDVKPQDTVRAMGFSFAWTLICGKGQSKAPDARQRKQDIRRFVTQRLRERFGIECAPVYGNRGRIVLNAEQVKRYIMDKKNRERSVSASDLDFDFEQMTCARLKAELRKCKLAVTGKKMQLIDRLKAFHQL